MCHAPQCQTENTVYEDIKRDDALTDAHSTVEEFMELVQYHDCASTYDIDNVRLSMASAECRACLRDEIDRTLYASLSVSYKAYHVADSVLKHLLRSSDSPTPTVTNATFELKRTLEGHKTKRLTEGLMAQLGAKEDWAVKPHEYKLLIEVLLEILFPRT